MLSCHAVTRVKSIDLNIKINPGVGAGHNRCDLVPDVLSLTELGWVTTGVSSFYR